VFKPYWYQRGAVDAAWEYLRSYTDNPCIEIPTGGGKSAVIALLASEAVKRWGGRAMVLAHVKELLQQNANALLRVCPDLDIGVYSAGLGMRNTSNDVIVAGIQSVVGKHEIFGKRDLLFIDEAHLIKVDGEGSYVKFIDGIKERYPHVRVIGLTATPYRMSSGEICGPGNILNRICYRVGIRELIAKGHLSPLISKRGLHLDFSELHMQAGEFKSDEAEKLMLDVVPQAVGELLRLTKDRKSVLLFTQSKEHAKAVQDRLIQQGEQCGYIDGETIDRGETLGDFKARRLKYLVNINVLTTGFDAPNVDAVGLLRPTASPGLYYQMVGRGFRIAEGKANCLVLDFGGNVLRHGPVDSIQIRSKHGGKSEATERVKTCPVCLSLVDPAFSVCPDCGHVFPERGKASHEATAGEESILSEPETFDVKAISYSRHMKKDADEDTPATFRADYRIGVNQFISEYVCFEHTGFARKKAEAWWQKRSQDPVPATASEAMEYARGGQIAETKTITAVSEGRWWRIKDAVIGGLPESKESLLEIDEDEVPF